MALDATEGVVGIVVGLFDETQFLSLQLVETGVDTVDLLETLETEDEELGVMLVGERREGNGRHLAALKPVDGGSVDGDGDLTADVGTILEVVMLAFLLSLEPETSETAEVLATDSLVNSGSTSDALAVVVSGIGPPVSLLLDISQDHVLDGDRHARHLPGDVSLEAVVHDEEGGKEESVISIDSDSIVASLIHRCDVKGERVVTTLCLQDLLVLLLQTCVDESALVLSSG
mmetsp:Transcript_1930/g.3397  ORF Transcript_1930/g.3397 Transcript_1930/m.3397 type:complete len:231 (+) Transcript_1930:2533-3225(+)